MPDPRSSDARGLLAPEVRSATLAIWAIVGLAAFEGLAVAAGLPDVAGDLGQVDLLPWVITSYLLTAGVATVVAGPLVDGLGVRRVFRVAVILFTVAGTAAAFAPSMPVMIAARIVQGVGAGMASSVGLAAVSLVFPPRLVSRAYAANSTVWGVMGVAGPAIAALMLTVASWRWIFGINLPLGGLALVLGWNAFPGPVGHPRIDVDVRGTALVAAFTISTLAAVDAIGPRSVAWVAAAAAAIVGYRLHASRRPRPVVELRHVSGAPFGLLGASVAALLAGSISASSYLPLYVRAGRGAGPGLTAWSLVFFVMGWTSGANLSSRLLDRMDHRAIVTRGFLVSIFGITSIAVLTGVNAPLPAIFAAFFVAGIGAGGVTNASLTLLRELTDDHEVGRAVSAHQFMRNQGFTIGAALGGTVLLFVVGNAVGDVEIVRDLLGGGDAAAALSPDVAAAVRRGYATATAIGAVVATVGFLPLLALRRHLDADGRMIEDPATVPAAVG